MRDTTLRLLTVAARGSGSPHDEDAELLSIVMAHFLVDSMTLYQAYALCRRFDALGHCPISTAQTPVTQGIAQGIAPLRSPFLEVLLAGPARSTRWSWVPLVLRQRWRSLKRDGLSTRTLRAIDPARDIVAIRRTPLIAAHARAVPDRVQYSNISDWFNSSDFRFNGDASRLAAASPVIDAAIDAVRAAFVAGNEELPQYLADYLRDWLANMTGVVRFYMDALLQRSDRLPKRLWVDSSSLIWTKILRHATRRAGGTVTGHDHAMGIGHLVTADKMLSDFVCCDVFVTFTEHQALGLRNGLRADLLVPLEPPEIIPVPATRTFAPQPRAFDAENVDDHPSPSQIRTVMYPSSFYVLERLRYGVALPDVVALDWEARLFSHLNDWGYKILHKPHPASRTLPPTGFTEAFGGTMLTQRFEDVMHLADIFIFVHPQSSPFITIMASGKPAVFVDLGLVQWEPAAYAMLARRCSVVKGWVDDENRVRVDWDDLRIALEECRRLNDPIFFDSYLRIEQ